MADILIKGMKMKDYPQSITINPDGSVIKDTFGLHRPVEEWKAIEVSADRDAPMLVPKKDIHVDEFICPNCGEELTIYCHVWQRYCPMCGQRIYEASTEDNT